MVDVFSANSHDPVHSQRWYGYSSRKIYQTMRDFFRQHAKNHPPSFRPTYSVALSGGPDSLALLAAAAYCHRFEPECQGRVQALIVNHNLQESAAHMTQQAYEQAEQLGVGVQVISVTVTSQSGLEADARAARYQALLEHMHGSTLLLGHTRDDQIETILLGLNRGSGAHILAGMDDHPHLDYFALAPDATNWHQTEPESQAEPERQYQIYRPMLWSIQRKDTWQACHEWGLHPIFDEHNCSEVLLRSQVRQHVIPVINSVLGAHWGGNLLKSAAMIREDTTALDMIARRIYNECHHESGRLDCEHITEHPPAIAQRIIKIWLENHHCQPSHIHIHAIMQLVNSTSRTGQCAIPSPQDSTRSPQDAITARASIIRWWVHKRCAEGKTYLMISKE